MSQSPNPAEGAEGKNPAELVHVYAEVAQRASRVLSGFMERQAQKGATPSGEEVGIAKAFMDLSARLMQNPYQLAQTQMNMVHNYFSLWQNSMMRMMGMQAEATVAPERSDKRFKDEGWQQDFVFDFIKQSYLIASKHILDTVGTVEGMDDKQRDKVNFYTRQCKVRRRQRVDVLTGVEVHFFALLVIHALDGADGIQDMLGGDQVRLLDEVEHKILLPAFVFEALVRTLRCHGRCGFHAHHAHDRVLPEREIVMHHVHLGLSQLIRIGQQAGREIHKGFGDADFFAGGVNAFLGLAFHKTAQDTRCALGNFSIDMNQFGRVFAFCALGGCRGLRHGDLRQIESQKNAPGGTTNDFPDKHAVRQP